MTVSRPFILRVFFLRRPPCCVFGLKRGPASTATNSSMRSASSPMLFSICLILALTCNDRDCALLRFCSLFHICLCSLHILIFSSLKRFQSPSITFSNSSSSQGSGSFSHFHCNSASRAKCCASLSLLLLFSSSSVMIFGFLDEDEPEPEPEDSSLSLFHL